MNTILVTLQLLVVLSAAVAAPAAGGDKSTVVLLHALFRHGNRTPDKSSIFPTDPHINETYASIGYSQLTPKGKRTELEIGRYIRQVYGHLIPDQYAPDVVYSISTNMKRTKMSLELVLTGLFPPVPTDIFEPGLEWQPLPFNIEPSQGLIGVASAYCTNYISQYYSYVMSKEAQNIRASYAQVYQELSTLTGNYIQTPRDAAGIYFALKSEDDYGLKLPKWAHDYYPAVLEMAGSLDYEYSTATPTLTKLSAGFLLKKILQDSLAKANGTLSPTTKAFLYSAHEYNVATMLRALNVFYRHIPPFGATIFFEIHNISGQYGLKLYYQNYLENQPILLTIPGCTDICPLNQVLELLQDSIPGDSDVCSLSTEMM